MADVRQLADQVLEVLGDLADDDARYEVLRLAAQRLALPGRAWDLYRMLRPGTPVVLQMASYRGQAGEVHEMLTRPDEDRAITGFCRYAIDIGDGHLVDACRYEFKTVARERKPRQATSPSP